MAHVHAARAVLPEMLERGSGYLLHTASTAGILTTPGDAHSSVAKHAVVGLAEWLSVHYLDRGIRTSLRVPLGVNTPMLPPGADRVPGPIREPEEVA
jgi:NAD(P)-dependent dehydrogenase (short-subunit alcohol dehydrogenase family)